MKKRKKKKRRESTRILKLEYSTRAKKDGRRGKTDGPRG